MEFEDKDKVIMKIGYEDTDKKPLVDIYGSIFEMNMNENIIKELEDIDKNDENGIEEIIEKIIGEGSIKKINDKRVSDGYEVMDLNEKVKLVGFLFVAYTKALTDSSIGKVEEAFNTLDKRINKFNNRAERRYKKRNKYNRR